MHDCETLENRLLAFRGYARVRLSEISFEKHKRHRRELSTSNVERLEAIFAREGCKWWHEDHVISVVVDEKRLDRALAKAKLNGTHIADFGSNLSLLDLERVEGLDGQHRIAAGKTFLSNSEKWWAARIFVKSELSLKRVVFNTLIKGAI